MHSVLEIITEDPESAGPDLISLDDLKFALGITSDTEDAQLQAMIIFQSRIIADYCDRRFGLAEALETFTFDRGEVMPVRASLTLSLYPVSEIIEVSTGADYEFDPATGRLWHGSGYWSGPVAVNYSGGYTLPEQAPARLQKAVIESIRESRTSGSRDPSIRSVSHGDVSIAYFTNETATTTPGFLSGPVIDLIRPYRRLHVA